MTTSGSTPTAWDGWAKAITKHTVRFNVADQPVLVPTDTLVIKAARIAQREPVEGALFW